MNNIKMKIEIWSDVMCPFCYLGKRKFESALNQFQDKNNIEVIWKSFQLQPNLKTDISLNIDEYLAKIKGFPLEQAQKMNSQVTQMAAAIGLEYNFNIAKVANTFKAHLLLHYSKSKNMQNEAKELLLKSYFTDGKNIDDIPTLLEIGKVLGFDIDELETALINQTHSEEVLADINEASNLGIHGVPFFIFNRKYAISGAQDSKIFAEALEKSYKEWNNNNKDD